MPSHPLRVGAYNPCCGPAARRQQTLASGSESSSLRNRLPVSHRLSGTRTRAAEVCGHVLLPRINVFKHSDQKKPFELLLPEPAPEDS